MGAIQNDKVMLDFDKEKVQPLSLQMLKTSHQEDDVYGNPLRGIHHYQLLEGLQEQAAKRGFELEMYDLFAANNKDRTQPGVVLLPKMEAQFGPRAVEAHIFRRVYANIRIKNFDDDVYTTNMAVAFHQKGIQVAVGNNVKICHNQCMLGTKKFFVSTYSEKGNGRQSGLPKAQEVIPIVGGFLDKLEPAIIAERSRIEQMKQIILTVQQLHTLICTMLCMRVAADTKYAEIHDNVQYPLNSTQINTFTEQIMLKKKRQGEISLWDFYDTATNLYKAQSMEIPNIIPQNRAMVELIDSQMYN